MLKYRENNVKILHVTDIVRKVGRVIIIIVDSLDLIIIELSGFDIE